jgi:spore coat polysaccharide biosynthesis protein SpsF (cytidylyltransferase family)/sialic acid synthase SpsE
MTYKIIELANTHSGSFEYFEKLVDSFAEYTQGYGMKFQPFHADKIATTDFPWYSVYQELLFDENQWKTILQKADKTKDIWLDVFDEYSIEILTQNLELVYGLKLQVSVLFNSNIIDALTKINLSEKKLIINVAALEINEIEKFVDQIEQKLNPQELLIEVGFQANPTELSDSGLSKIQIIKDKFGKRIVFADHIAHDNEYAVWIPAIAVAAGADIIEKHVMLDEETKYDKYSSLTPANFKKMVSVLDNYDKLMVAPFINDRERVYLSNSLMKPILVQPKEKGQLISYKEDLAFKRSGKFGLNVLEIQNIQSSFHVLAQNKNSSDTLKKEDFKRANIAAIVAGRLKSSRLKAKALKKIGDHTSVEYCLKNVSRFQNVNHVILATSYLESDKELENHTYNDAVIFHKGHPEDVIQRYLDIIRELKVDVIIRVTADMPFVDDEICQILLRSHFEKGADFTIGRHAAVGTNLEIISVEALERVKAHFPSADYSEYMTWYFLNNSEYFNINWVDLPPDLVRDYRLTLDYHEDLELFNKIDEALKEKVEFNARDIFYLLDNNPELPAINSHLTLKYRTDKKLIDTLDRVTKIHG